VIKPFPVAARWALRVTDEFFLQVDKTLSNSSETARFDSKSFCIAAF
jgi:hypothetical protein